MFPAETNEPNTPPEEWTKNQLKRWLESVSPFLPGASFERNLCTMKLMVLM